MTLIDAILFDAIQNINKRLAERPSWSRATHVSVLGVFLTTERDHDLITICVR